MANINRPSHQQQPSLLAHPTLYHIQQQQENNRFKDSTSMSYGDTTMLEQHQHMFFPQQPPHHPQQESSPNLSDLDCSEFTTTSSVSGMPGTDLLLQSPPSAAQMSSSNEDYLYNHDGMTPVATAKHHRQHQPYQQDPYVMLPNGGSPYYYGSSSNNRPTPAFTMSAPSGNASMHHHYHHQPSLVGSLGDTTTQGAAMGATAERSIKDPYEDDIAAQAK